jgi:integrase/recombinase XerD
MAGMIGNPTLEYLGVSDSSKKRHIQQVLEFFKGFPPIIQIETSKMANPAYVIGRLAESTTPQKKRELRNRFVIGFLFWTGVRVNELLKTRREDLDLIGRTYNVPTLKQRRTTYRPIPLDHVPVKELKLWGEYLYHSRGLRLVGLSDRQVERIVKAVLGDKFTPHTLRHGLGLWLYEYTRDIRTVAQILRHTNIANTLIYTRLSLEAIREKIRL